MKLPESFEGRARRYGPLHRQLQHLFRDVPPPIQRGVVTMVVCATSIFTKRAKHWWTYRREDFWVNDYRDPAGPRYRYPHWDDFVREFKAMFRDPAIEEVHEKRMKEMKMGGDPATVFFQKLEHEAKLAGRHDDTNRHGMMVTTVRQGVPWSYTSIISSIGVSIPQTYDEWKERILVMYEECNETAHTTRRTALVSTTEATTRNREDRSRLPPPAVQRILQVARQVPLAETKVVMHRGRWHTVSTKTYGGAGQPMDIDARNEKKQKQRNEGRASSVTSRGI